MATIFLMGFSCQKIATLLKMSLLSSVQKFYTHVLCVLLVPRYSKTSSWAAMCSNYDVPKFMFRWTRAQSALCWLLPLVSENCSGHPHFDVTNAYQAAYVIVIIDLSTRALNVMKVCLGAFYERVSKAARLSAHASCVLKQILHRRCVGLFQKHSFAIHSQLPEFLPWV